MRKYKLYIIFFALGVILSLLVSDKYIHISFANTTNIDPLEITYAIDEGPLQLRAVDHATIPMIIDSRITSVGKHNIRVSCEKLNLDTVVNIFTIKNNYLGFEIQERQGGEGLFLVRSSWRRLIYQ